jgi:death on curing protein
MTSEPTFLTVRHVLLMHSRAIAQYGGDPGALSLDLLESAVMMPQAAFGGEYLHQGLAAMAAAYLFHLCKNHPFVDANKRVALAAAETFLLLNGRYLHATNSELVRLTLRVAEGRVPKDELTRFFEERVTDAV